MILRTAITTWVLLISASAWGEGASGGGGGGAHQNAYMMQQAMGGDKTAQMMMMMGGGMGGGGSQGGAKYESKAENIQKALEQPAKEIAKGGDERVKNFTAFTDKVLSETSKTFATNTAKDEKLDDKLVAQISAPPPSNAKMVKDSTDELIGLTKVAGDAQKNFVDAQAKRFLNPVPLEETPANTMLTRLGGAAAPARSSATGLAGALQARSPASDSGAASENPALNHNPGANGGAAIPPTDGRGIGSGLNYNPPKGF